MTTNSRNEIADAIDRNFTSPNEVDSNLEAANIVDALFRIAEAIRYHADSLVAIAELDRNSKEV